MLLFSIYHICNKFAPSPYLKKAYNFATHWQPVASRHLQSSNGCKDICEVSSLHACKDSKDERFSKSQHLCTQICIMGKFDFSSRVAFPAVLGLLGHLSDLADLSVPAVPCLPSHLLVLAVLRFPAVRLPLNNACLRTLLSRVGRPSLDPEG